VSLINEYEHNCDTNPFDVFNYGASLWKMEQFQDDFIDRIRQYVEECENMQVKDSVLNDGDAISSRTGLLKEAFVINLNMCMIREFLYLCNIRQ
jgi:hypothetical protein